MLSGDGIPLDGVLDVLGATNAHLGIVTHGELGRWKTLPGSLFGKSESEGFIFFETSAAIIFATSTQEPFTEGHVGFYFALLACKTIVLDAEEWIKGKGGLSIFIRMTEFVLCRGEMKVGGTF